MGIDAKLSRPTWLLMAVVLFLSPGVSVAHADKAEARNTKPEDELEDALELDPDKIEYLRGVVSKAEEARETAAYVSAFTRLKGGFPESRVVLHEALTSSSARLRSLALRVLAEEGEEELDMAMIAKCLSDPIKRVRLSAVMALRPFGAAANESIVRYLPGERDHNNRKMAIKSLKYSADRSVIPFLVELLEREKHKRVLPFLVDALEDLSGRKIGLNIPAWKDVARMRIVAERGAKQNRENTEADSK